MDSENKNESNPGSNNNYYEQLKEFAYKSWEKLEEQYEITKVKFEDRYESSKEKFEEQYEITKEKMGETYENVKEKAGEGYQYSKEKVNEGIQISKEHLTNFGNSINEKLPEKYQYHPDGASSNKIVEETKNNENQTNNNDKL
ncbi:hypothetical protein ACTA71_009184 [Dictyostelium dimigraforme]